MQGWPIAKRFYNGEMKPVLQHVFDKELQDSIKILLRKSDNILFQSC
jgi:hypothetical protein